MNHRAPVRPPAAFRGAAVGALSAALAVAAHGAGGGGLPQSSSLTLLAAACVGLGVLVAQYSARGAPATAVALVAGQSLGHLVLAVETPGHALLPGAVMLSAHAAATVVCAIAVSAVEQLYGPIVAVWRAVFATRPYPVTAPRHVPPTSDHHLPVVALLRASISRRGPPIPA